MEKLMEEKKTTLWQEIKICRVDETNYPHDLKKIKDRPEVLYYRGNIDISTLILLKKNKMRDYYLKLPF